jgi:hypothetical protein
VLDWIALIDINYGVYDFCNIMRIRMICLSPCLMLRIRRLHFVVDQTSPFCAGPDVSSSHFVSCRLHPTPARILAQWIRSIKKTWYSSHFVSCGKAISPTHARILAQWIRSIRKNLIAWYYLLQQRLFSSP